MCEFWLRKMVFYLKWFHVSNILHFTYLILFQINILIFLIMINFYKLSYKLSLLSSYFLVFLLYNSYNTRKLFSVRIFSFYVVVFWNIYSKTFIVHHSLSFMPCFLRQVQAGSGLVIFCFHK